MFKIQWDKKTGGVILGSVVTKDTLIYLGQIIRHGRLPKEMRGPLGIAEASGDAD